MTEQPRHDGPDLLVVCRANRARSPVVAELLRRYADAHDVRPRPTISSGGLEAVPGLGLLPSMKRALASRNLSVPGHTSRPFRIEEAEAARLVITFSHADKKKVVARRPALVPRTYTLRELVRLVRSPHWRPDWSGLPDVAVRLHGLRPLVEPGDDDTPDPAELSRWRVRRLLDDMTQDVVAVAPAVLGGRNGHRDAAWRP